MIDDYIETETKCKFSTESGSPPVLLTLYHFCNVFLLPYVGLQTVLYTGDGRSVYRGYQYTIFFSMGWAIKCP